MTKHLLIARILTRLRKIFVPSTVGFFYIQRIKGFNIASKPNLHPLSYELFISKLDRANFYLEYGSGGSTYIAAEKGKDFISVDSDPYFLEAVRKKIQASGLYNPSRQKYLYADIGLTKSWGHPLFKNKTKKRLVKWANYPNSPWIHISADRTPDLILVDGRFRVACALTTIKHLQNKTGWTLLVDDYLARQQYKAIENFANLESLTGRMAVFTKKENINMSELETALDFYVQDWL